MTRILYEAASLLFVGTALYDAGFAVTHGVPSAWALFVAPCLVYGVITLSQRLPIASLNLTVNVTAENAPRIEPVAREFLASIKAFTLGLILWVNQFVVFRGSMPLFFLVEGAFLVMIFASVFAFRAKLNKLA